MGNIVTARFLETQFFFSFPNSQQGSKGRVGYEFASVEIEWNILNNRINCHQPEKVNKEKERKVQIPNFCNSALTDLCISCPN